MITRKGLIVLAAVMFIFAVSGLRGIATAADEKSGEASKDYMTYLNALQKRDGATIRKMAEVGPVSDKELKEQMDMMSAMTPTNQKIMSATTNKDTVVLKIIGKLEGKKQYGTIEMHKKGGVWKITKEDWSENEKK
jgi:hypothetical protein